MNKYDVYQHLMDYWNDIMQDDCYFIAVEGWKAELTITKQTKTVTEWDCDLVPKALVIDRYFGVEAQGIATLEAEKEAIATEITELEEEHNTEDGYFADLDKVNKANVQKRLKELFATKPKKEKQELANAAEPEMAYGEQAVLEHYLKLLDKQTAINKKIKEALADLDKKVIERYKTLTENEIKQLVVDDKWMTVLERDVKTEMERISQRLTQRIKELAERYETPLPKQTDEVKILEEKVNAHLVKMGFKWQNV
jgi:type I restriction enzyme M protein